MLIDASNLRAVFCGLSILILSSAASATKPEHPARIVYPVPSVAELRQQTHIGRHHGSGYRQLFTLPAQCWLTGDYGIPFTTGASCSVFNPNPHRSAICRVTTIGQVQNGPLIQPIYYTADVGVAPRSHSLPVFVRPVYLLPVIGASAQITCWH